MAELASRDETLAALENILADGDHAAYMQAMKFATERGYGALKQTVDLEGGVQIIVGAGPMGIDAKP